MAMDVMNKRNDVDFSIIIPQKNSIHTLRRLFDSIPVSEKIEIIVVDNSPIPVTKDDIGIDREYSLLWAHPSRYAGGARNVGIDAAVGKWLLFADADDYYTKNAFDSFYAEIDANVDVVYFKMTGIYPETGEYSSRGEAYSLLVTNYLKDGDEMPLRLKFLSPWAKMIRRSFVMERNLRFDEVIASNDSMFSTKVGFYARAIKAVDKEVGVITVTKGSLTKRRDFEVIHSRYLVALRRNQFLKQKQLGVYQSMVIHYLYQSLRCGFSCFFLLMKEAVSYRQNIFFNTRKLFKGYNRYLKKEKKETEYIVR